MNKTTLINRLLSTGHWSIGWINQPSKHQNHHKYHGYYVLISEDVVVKHQYYKDPVGTVIFLEVPDSKQWYLPKILAYHIVANKQVITKYEQIQEYISRTDKNSSQFNSNKIKLGNE